MSMAGVALFPGCARAPSIDPYEVPPGNPLWFALEGFDTKGEVLHYTITFKKAPEQVEAQRPIDYMLIERSIADQNPTIEIAMQFALQRKVNISERTVGEFENDRDSQIMALFFNHLREGDTKDWDNASVNIRFDYYLTGSEKERESPLPMIVLIFCVVSVLVVLVVLLVRRFKRGRKDAVTFFNPEEGPYYVVRALADSKIFYLDPNQYSLLYSSGRLGEFEFLGTSPRIGGMIIPPDGQALMGFEPQALPAIPFQEAFVSDGLQMASMAAQPSTVQTGWDTASPGQTPGSASEDDPQGAYPEGRVAEGQNGISYEPPQDGAGTGPTASDEGVAPEAPSTPDPTSEATTDNASPVPA